MKAISIKQPWAELIVCGRKTIETRTWKTDYRGEILICASLGWDKSVAERFNCTRSHAPDRGAAIAYAVLVDVRPMRISDEPFALCYCQNNLYAWILADVRRSVPFSVKGKLGLFDVKLPQGRQVCHD